MSTRLISCFRVLALGVIIAMPGMPVAATEVVDNGCTDAQGVRYANCSRLNSGGDRVTIQATDCGNPSSTSPTCPGSASITSVAAEDAAQCRTIYNNSPIDYFVPWKTPMEWGSFLAWVNTNGALKGLSTYNCCQPKTGSVCADQSYNGTPIGPAGIPVFDPSTGQPIQLGKRMLGKRAGNVSNFGAQKDVSNTLDAAALLGDATINYKVTYVCDNAAWVKTFEEGSCTPLDGACGPSVPQTVTPLLFTALQQQNLLCVDGSIMQNLVDHTTYWSWDCLGTPTRATATCAAANATNNTGSPQCGTAAYARLASMPSTTDQLCAAGIPTAIGGTGSQASPWSWNCNGTSGAYMSCLAYQAGTRIDGVCGGDNGTSNPNAGWMPTALCSNGTLPTAAGITTSATDWQWACAGENGGTDTPCQATLQTHIGTCNWPAVDGSSGATPPNPGTDVMCSVGTPSAITYRPSIEGDGRMVWYWECNGNATPACDGSYQCICEKYDLSGPQAGVCGGDNGSTNYYTGGTPPSDLCGTNSNVVTGPTWNTALTPPQWEWTCQGINSGSTVACGSGNAPVAGVCNVDPNFIVTPTTPLPLNACGLGQTAYDFIPVGANYTFKCPGILTGATTTCSVKYDPGAVYGVCGFPYGQQLGTGVAPADPALCSTGTPIGQHFDPIRNERYMWTCQGSAAQYDDPKCRVYIKPQEGVCGAASVTPQNSAPSGSNACAYGSVSAVTALNPGWAWTCTGQAGSVPMPTPCNAAQAAGAGAGNDGVCGSADGSETNVTPTANLCTIGTSSAVIGTGPWTWTCQSTNGGLTAACIATLPAATAPGACGLANGTTIPSKPNINLCTGGNPSVVSGTGPWTWDCMGTNTVSCSANLCDVCAGNIAGGVKNEAISTQFITYGGGVCQVSGSVTWTEGDILSSNNAAQLLRIKHDGSGVMLDKVSLPPAAAAEYCPPCYMRAKSISGNFTVQKAGVCTGTLNDGNSVTIAIDPIADVDN
jgi:hypothetical protein